MAAEVPLYPREPVVGRFRVAVTSALIDLAKEHRVTAIEVMQTLAGEMMAWAGQAARVRSGKVGGL